MEHEAKLMEDKLVKLKQFVVEENVKDQKREETNKTKNRWGNQNAPIRRKFLTS